MAKLLRSFNGLLNLIFPKRCSICARLVYGEEYLCGNCLPPIPLLNTDKSCSYCSSPILDRKSASPNSRICAVCIHTPNLFSKIGYIWEYEGEAKDLITTLKFQPSLGACKQVGKLASANFTAIMGSECFDLIVPIPLSRSTAITRGFNQCAVVAREICIDHNIALSLSALRQIRPKVSQIRLSHNQRISNVKNLYRADSNQVKNQKILLLDDVITTGATANSAAAELLSAGAKSVYLFALARSESWHEYRADIFQRIARNIIRN